MKEFSDAEMLKSKIERIQEKISFAIWLRFLGGKGGGGVFQKISRIQSLIYNEADNIETGWDNLFSSLSCSSGFLGFEPHVDAICAGVSLTNEAH
jgi:hypothetical protein